MTLCLTEKEAIKLWNAMTDNSFSPSLMGILNITPDSFFDQGRYAPLEKALRRAMQIYEEGASILDIGGESTRPGSNPVTVEEEIERIKPVLQALYQRNYPLPISIDTRNPATAQVALDLGAQLINDVSGALHPAMRKLAVQYKVDLCIMHMLGNPKTMQISPIYSEGVIPYLLRWFESRITLLVQDGIDRTKIILDPGIGFGKRATDNMEIYKNLSHLKAHFGLRMMIGGSHKSFMRTICEKENLLSATLIMHTIAAIQKIDILRVHNIGEHSDLAKLVHAYLH